MNLHVLSIKSLISSLEILNFSIVLDKAWMIVCLRAIKLSLLFLSSISCHKEPTNFDLNQFICVFNNLVANIKLIINKTIIKQ